MTVEPPAIAVAAEPDDRILPWSRVKDVTGISRTTAWRLQNTGQFPRPVMLSPGRVGWRESEVRAWRVSRAPRGQPPPAPAPASLFEAPPAAPRPQAGQGRPTSQPAPPPPSPRQRTPSRRPRAAAPNQLSFDF